MMDCESADLSTSCACSSMQNWLWPSIKAGFPALFLRGSEPCSQIHVQIGHLVWGPGILGDLFCKSLSLAMKHVANLFVLDSVPKFAMCFTNLWQDKLQTSSQDSVLRFLQGCICNARCCKAPILLNALQNYENPAKYIILQGFPLARLLPCKANFAKLSHPELNDWNNTMKTHLWKGNRERTK